MMQSQGLGALMPQAAPQMAPQQASPRLTAATNLVSSDAERQILDPRTLALIKYKDAIQAMQAADQMMAAAQPAPMPPTVAERTKLAAEQGIAGLASKLGAGIQQQGNNMQAQQMQQAMSGGLPQLPAPNMAGMAQGGIVGFQEGGRPEDTIIAYYSDGTPIYASEVARMDNAGAIDETPEGIERRAQYEAMQGDRVNLRDLAQTPAQQEPREQTSVPTNTYGTGDRTGQGGTLRGIGEGIVGLLKDRASGAMRSIPEISEEELLAATTSGSKSRDPISKIVERLTPKRSVGEAFDFANQYVLDQFLRATDGSGETATTGPTSATTQAEAPAVSTVQTPRRQMDRVPESEALAAMSPSGPQTAAEYLMEYGQAPEQQPRAGESAADRDARRRMLIAGLRGFGAQGLGGFAAGTAEEELRQEQEVIADQERRRRAAMETRGLDLEERNITLQDAIRQQQLSQQQRADAEMLQYRYDQLNQRQQEAVDEAVNEETAMLRQALQALDSQIPNLKDGFFSSDLSDAVAQRESLVQQILAARARILEMYSGTQYGPAQTGQAGLAPEDDALVSEYLNR